MSFAALAARLPFDAERRHHGLQLAAAVLLASAVSALLALPEHLWAVMSALIVLRPSSGATWEASWDRTRATLIGAVAGLLGVFLQHHGSHPQATLLAIVVGLAFASAASPAFRSAPVAALIILAAGDLPGHSALQVAALRVAQILIGVAVAMAVALVSSRYRAADRFCAGCAALLRQVGRQFQQPPAARTEAQAEQSAAAVRHALARLSVLAGSADHEGRPFGRARHAPGADRHRRTAALTARIVQDALLLKRLLRAEAGASNDADNREVARIAGAALATIAARVERRGQPVDGSVAAPTREAPSVAAGLAAPLRLLLDDVRQLDDLFRLSVDNTV
ncbi:MAG TPA: FUSC family protein [Variovorax sp.]|nr:FUSC family protein [Variovorax sp.]